MLQQWAATPVVLLASTMAFTAGCTDREDRIAERGGGAIGVVRYATSNQMPTCNPANRAHVYYVESEEQFYYCDGKHLRQIELTGSPGADGASWLVMTSSSAPACVNGGVQIFVGPDQNRDGTLSADEIVSTVSVCNGEPGPAGPAGADGMPGANGAPGADGQDGADGAPGSGCHVTDNGDGTKLLYCDDGTQVIIRDGDVVPVCGDQYVDPGEQRDDGGINTADCDSDCSLPVCGDGIVNELAGEQCEMSVSTPPCDSACQRPDEIQSIVANPTSLTFTEGASASFQVSLAHQPASNTTVVLSALPVGINLSRSQLTFQPHDFNIGQEVVVTSPIDPDSAGASSIVTLSTPGVTSATVAIQVSDPTILTQYGWIMHIGNQFLDSTKA